MYVYMTLIYFCYTGTFSLCSCCWYCAVFRCLE